MKLTSTQLRRIIKEEIKKIFLTEGAERLARALLHFSDLKDELEYIDDEELSDWADKMGKKLQQLRDAADD